MTDYNVDNYTLNELLEIVGLDLPATEADITEMTDLQIEKSKNQPELRKFYTETKTRLLSYLAENLITEIGEEGYGLHREYLQRPFSNNEPKVMDRINNLNVVTGRNRSVMLQGRLNNPAVEIQQGFMNKILRHTDTKMITIDSQFRKIHTFERPQIGATICDTSGSEMPTPPYISTDYVVDLPEPLTNVISMYVHSYEIPRTWYVFSNAYGTTSFDHVDDSAGTVTRYSFPEGNYTIATLFDLTASPSPFLPTTTPALPAGLTIHYDAVTSKVTFAVPDSADTIRFYDPSWDLSGCVQKGTYNGGAKEGYNLGWLLGFRANSYTGAGSYTSEGCLDVNGIKYLYILLDDFNSNTANSGITRINDTENTLSFPSYYTCDASGTYTEAQEFTINQILAQKNARPIDRHYGDMNSSIIARIPVFATNGTTFGTLYSQNASLSDNERTYYGPVTISRMRIALLDDKAHVIDLNNMNWSFAVVVKQLYQF